MTPGQDVLYHAHPGARAFPAKVKAVDPVTGTATLVIPNYEVESVCEADGNDSRQSDYCTPIPTLEP